MSQPPARPTTERVPGARRQQRPSIGPWIAVTSTAAAPTTSTEPTTTAAPTTTEAPTTTPAPTTQPPTSPPTTPPPTTAERDIVAEVTAAALETYDFYWGCLRRPVDCDPTEIAAPGSAALDGLTLTVNDLVGAEMFIGDQDPGYLVIEDVTIDGDQATVTSCWSLTAVLFGPPGPDGAPTVQNDTPGWSRQIDVYVTVDGAGWMISTSEVTERAAEVNECAPES